MNRIFGREPVMYITIIEAALVVAIGFGFDMSTEQMASIIALCVAVLGFVARQQVTPVEKLNAPPAPRHPRTAIDPDGDGVPNL